jgi:hypothetical protein
MNGSVEVCDGQVEVTDRNSLAFTVDEDKSECTVEETDCEIEKLFVSPLTLVVRTPEQSPSSVNGLPYCTLAGCMDFSLVHLPSFLSDELSDDPRSLSPLGSPIHSPPLTTRLNLASPDGASEGKGKNSFSSSSPMATTYHPMFTEAPLPVPQLRIKPLVDPQQGPHPPLMFESLY